MQRTLVALAVVALVAGCASAQSCENVTAETNFYLTPQNCSNAHVQACMDSFGACMSANSVCAQQNECLQAQIVCLNNLPTVSESGCSEWYTALTGAIAAVAANGTYNGSALESACMAATCQWANDSSVNTTECPVEFSSVCTMPQELSQLVVTFAGNWSEQLSNETIKASIMTAVEEGIAASTDLGAYAVRTLSVNEGSLVASSIVLNTSVSATSANASLADVAANTTLTEEKFMTLAGMANASNMSLEITSVAVQAPTTPAPMTTPAPGTPAPAVNESFAVTFAGNWSDKLANATLKAEITTAVKGGLASTLNVSESDITILSVTSGSLVVNFTVAESANVDGNAVATSLANMANNETALQETFSQLATVSGITVEVTAIAAEGSGVTPSPDFTPTTPTPTGGTPAPTTPAPTGGAALPLVSAAVAVAVAALLL